MKNKNINHKLLLGTLLLGGVATITMASETVHAEENNAETLNESAKKTLNKVNLAGSLGNTMETVKESQDGLDLAVKPVKPVQASVKSEGNVKVPEKQTEVVQTTKAASQAPAKKEEVKTSKVDALIASGNSLKVLNTYGAEQQQKDLIVLDLFNTYSNKTELAYQEHQQQCLQLVQK